MFAEHYTHEYSMRDSGKPRRVAIGYQRGSRKIHLEATEGQCILRAASEHKQSDWFTARHVEVILTLNTGRVTPTLMKNLVRELLGFLAVGKQHLAVGTYLLICRILTPISNGQYGLATFKHCLRATQKSTSAI